MTNKQIVGEFGEDLARKYLIKNGYDIIAGNIKIGYKEIDIIARKKELLVFVEVKTRTSSFYGEADEAVTAFKTNNLKQAVSAYLAQKKNNYDDIRLDLVSVDIDKRKKTAKIRHYEDIA